jgi:hypothetical protein
MKAKYIIIKRGGIEYPLVFSELMEHAATARAIGGDVLSGGFCYTEDDTWVCYGESISLRLKSRGDVDSKVLNEMLTARY